MNDLLKSFKNIKAGIKVLKSDSKLIYDKEKEISIGENNSEKIIELPELNDKSNLFFIDLELKDSSDKLVSDNFYWIPGKEDVLDFKNSTWYYTPVKTPADLKEINNLPRANINYNAKFSSNNQNVEITLENTSDKIAFFIELKVVNEKTGESFLPVFWTDNYISILPHSKKTIKGTFKNPLDKKPKLIINGWNTNNTL